MKVWMIKRKCARNVNRIGNYQKHMTSTRRRGRRIREMRTCIAETSISVQRASPSVWRPDNALRPLLPTRAWTSAPAGVQRQLPQIIINTLSIFVFTKPTRRMRWSPEGVLLRGPLAAHSMGAQLAAGPRPVLIHYQYMINALLNLINTLLIHCQYIINTFWIHY